MEADDWIRKTNAQLRYYFHIQDPDSLTDEVWASRFQELQYVRKEEAKNP